MMRANGWMLLSLVMLLTGCATGDGYSVIAPKLPGYSIEFEMKLLEELEAGPGPCARDYLVTPCSASYRFANDHVHLRDQIRAALERPD